MDEAIALAFEWQDLLLVLFLCPRAVSLSLYKMIYGDIEWKLKNSWISEKRWKAIY
jgi:hypothetical protein